MRDSINFLEIKMFISYLLKTQFLKSLLRVPSIGSPVSCEVLIIVCWNVSSSS